MQLDLDIRSQMVQLADDEAAAEATPIAPAAEPRRTFRRSASPRQIELVRTMLDERFPQEEADRRFGAFDWNDMPRSKFDEIYSWLKDRPKLNDPARPEAPATVREPIRGTLPGGLIEGKFTVVFEDGSHKTLRVKRQSADAAFKPDALLIGMLIGPDNDGDYVNMAHVGRDDLSVSLWRKAKDNPAFTDAVRVLVADPLAAALAYSAASGTCPFCSNTLTHPDSLHNGWGEECASKRNLPYEKAPVG